MKLLVLLSRIPFPLEKGDKLRAFHQIRCLSEHFELHLCCLSDTGNVPGATEALKPYCKSLKFITLPKISIYWHLTKTLFSNLPLQVGYFYNNKAQKQVNEYIKTVDPDHIFCQLLRVAEYVKFSAIAKTIDYQDVFSKGYERQAQTSSWYLKPVFRREARLLKIYEKKIFDWFDHHTIISMPDREEIDHPRKDNIQIVHNGVDIKYFSSCEFEKNIDILFTGNMNYPPNVIGAEFLIKQVLPLLNKYKPGLKFMIAGVNPSKRIQSLASQQVIVTGWIDDIRKAYLRSRIFVAPMMIGTGLQNKLLEAMAMKLPCITSPLANAALGASPGEQIMICNTIEDYVKAIISLLENKEISTKLSEEGLEFVKKNYNWEVETEKIVRLIKSIN